MTTQQPLVDINHGSIEELVAIKGIGPFLAKKIIDFRPYNELDDLIQVPGINHAKLAALLPYITLEIEPEKSKRLPKPSAKLLEGDEPYSTLGNTQAFVFLEDRNERQDALLIVLGGFIFGLFLLLLRRSTK
jgi:hypothetical protein